MWIEHDGKPLIGKGGAEILDQIEKEKSLSNASRKLGMSYRYVWSYIRGLEKSLSKPIVETYRGGKSGGGGARLTPLGNDLLEEYRRLEGFLNDALLKSKQHQPEKPERHATNRLKGKVIGVQKENYGERLKIALAATASLTVIVPKEVSRNLGIKVGDEVEAAVGATEVAITKARKRSQATR